MESVGGLVWDHQREVEKESGESMSGEMLGDNPVILCSINYKQGGIDLHVGSSIIYHTFCCKFGLQTKAEEVCVQLTADYDERLAVVSNTHLLYSIS